MKNKIHIKSYIFSEKISFYLIIFLFIIYASVPFFLTLSPFKLGLLSLFFSVIFLILSFFVQKVTKGTCEGFFFEIIFRTYLRVIFFLFSISFFSVSLVLLFEFLRNRINYIDTIEKYVVMFLILAFIANILFTMFELIYSLVKNTIHLNTLNKKNMLELLAVLIVIFLIPDLSFGSIYKFTLSVSNNESLKLFESYYLSFIIHHALPIENETFLHYINLINQEPLFRFIQIVHVNSCKFIDLTFIAIIINNFIQMFKERE